MPQGPTRKKIDSLCDQLIDADFPVRIQIIQQILAHDLAQRQTIAELREALEKAFATHTKQILEDVFGYEWVEAAQQALSKSEGRAL